MNRYGPEVVTSRLFSRWPAAHTRNASPHAPTAAPANNDDRVGCASHNAAAPERKPIDTRLRASASASRRRLLTTGVDTPLLMLALQGNPPLHGRTHLANDHLVEAPLPFVTATVVMTFALLVPGHHHVARVPGAVPRRIRRTEDADRRGPDRRRNVERTGVAGNHERRVPRQRHQIDDGGGRRRNGGPARARDHFLRQPLFARPPEHDGKETTDVTHERGDLTVACRRPPLVGPGRARIDESKGLAASDPLADLIQRARRRLPQRKSNRPLVYSHGAEKTKILEDNVRLVGRGGFGIERPRRFLAKVPDRESDHARGARRAGEHGRLQQPLQVDREIVGLQAKLAN